jgi:hypothetical protein
LQQRDINNAHKGGKMMTTRRKVLAGLLLVGISLAFEPASAQTQQESDSQSSGTEDRFPPSAGEEDCKVDVETSDNTHVKSCGDEVEIGYEGTDPLKDLERGEIGRTVKRDLRRLEKLFDGKGGMSPSERERNGLPPSGRINPHAF